MNTIYREYTAEQLHAQYSARDAVPDHPQIFQHWQQTSADYRVQARAGIDLRYGQGERQTLDLFLPPGKTQKAPLFIFIHGGYWQAMDKGFSSFIAKELNQQGIAVAIPNYDLCPNVGLDEITRQIRRAIVWLSQQGDQHSFDPEQLHISGHSAGGHLTAELIATDWQQHHPEFNPRVIRSGLSISGIFELEPLIHTGINKALGLDIVSARQNSPSLRQPKIDIPLILAVGGNEPEEFHRQSQQLANDWNRPQAAVRYLALPDRNHFTAIDQFTEPGSLLLSHLLKMLQPQG